MAALISRRTLGRLLVLTELSTSRPLGNGSNATPTMYSAGFGWLQNTSKGPAALRAGNRSLATIASVIVFSQAPETQVFLLRQCFQVISMLPPTVSSLPAPHPLRTTQPETLRRTGSFGSIRRATA